MADIIEMNQDQDQETSTTDVAGQSTGNSLPEIEGFSPEVVARVREGNPELFQGFDADAAQEDESANEAPAQAKAEDQPDQNLSDGDGTPQNSEQKTVPLAALHEERSKRQQIQGENDALRQQLNQMAQIQIEQARRMQQPEQPKQSEEGDPLETMVNQKVEERLKPLQEQRQREVQASQHASKVAQMEADARTRYADYDEVTKPVLGWLNEEGRKAAQGDQRSLQNIAMVMSQPNPAEAAYTFGIRFKFEQQRQQAQSAQAPASAPPAQTQQAERAKAEQMKNFPRGTEISGGGGGSVPGTVSTADLQKMSSTQWLKLPIETRRKLLTGNM